MHLHAKTKLDLEDALFTSQQGGIDYVIEVESCIDTNASFHRLVTLDEKKEKVVNLWLTYFSANFTTYHVSEKCYFSISVL